MRRSLLGLLILFLTTSLSAQELLRATGNGELAGVRAALASGTDVNETNDEGWTALMLAALHDEPEIAEVLIEAGADVTHRDSAGVSALTIAKAASAERIVELLRAAGATESLEERLDTAVRAGDREEVQALIDQGADVDALDTDDYQTPLMTALDLGQLEVFLTLVEAGASPTVQGTGIETTGESALRLAARKGSPWAFRLLVDHGVDRAHLEDALFVGCAQESIVRIAIEKGARPNVRGPGGETPLFCAASKGSRGAVEALLEAGADPETVSADGTSALAAAEKMGHTEIVRLLERAAR
jgi:ankyrin repeat protein